MSTLRVGLGTYRSFDIPLDGPAAAELALVLKAFHAGGGRFVDTSPMYGRAEAVLGRLSAQLGVNGSLQLATKVWIKGRTEGKRQMELSIAKLGRRKGVELMQVHNLLDWQAHWPTLEAFKAEGRIGAIGITHYQDDAIEDLVTVLRAKKLDWVQFPYNMGRRKAEKRLMDVAADYGVRCIANEPFGQGALFAAVKGKPLPAWVGAELGIRSWAQYFLLWILGEPRISMVIPATAKLAHFQDWWPAAAAARLPDPGQRERMAQDLAAL
jgi:diketogulonate reductase-like aldo/keto reductase